MSPDSHVNDDGSATAVVLAVDGGYLPHVPCMLGQLNLHAKGVPVVLVVAPDVDAEQLQSCQDVADRLEIDLAVKHTADITVMEASGSIASRDYVSAFTYVKLMFGEILPEFDEILYLDVDILIRGDLSPLLDWDLRHPIGAVPEVGVNGMHIHGTVQVPYFNAGVLRMSLSAMRRENFWDQARSVIQHRPRLRYQDQDVFNICFHERFDALPLTFNVFNTVSVAHPQLKLFSDPVLVHFTGPNKPWYEENLSPFAREWRAVNADVLMMPPERSEIYVRGVRLQEQSARKRLVERLRVTPAATFVRATVPKSVRLPIGRVIYAQVPEDKARVRRRPVRRSNQPVSRRAWQAARHSTWGSAVRAHTPNAVKRPASRAVWRVLPKGPRKPPIRVRVVGSARRSSVGSTLKTSLPVAVRRPVSRSLRRVTATTPQMRRELERERRLRQQERRLARSERTASGKSRASILLDRILGEQKVVVPGPPLRPDAVRLQMPLTSTSATRDPSRTAQAATVSTDVVTSARRNPSVRPQEAHLRLLISQARSGTNAVGGLIAKGFDDVTWIGEVYAGFIRQNHPADIVDVFPWIGDLDAQRTPGLSPAETPEWNNSMREYRERMSAEVVPVTEFLLANTPGICAAKIFDDHLTEEGLEELVATMRPPLLVQRRTYLYSLISWLRARESRQWSYVENTQTRVAFDASMVRRFVDRGERWHCLVAGLAAKYDVPVTFVSYEGLLENRTDLKVLRDFFADATLSKVAESDDSWLPMTSIQDRRTDEALTAVLGQFAMLPADLRMALMQLPGEAAWAGIEPVR